MLMGACYVYGYSSFNEEKIEIFTGDDGDANEKLESVGWEVPSAIKKLVKALDYGSGQERGTRK